MLGRAAAARGLGVGEPEELAHGRQAFERSDQVVFAEVGIPAILINEGLDWRSTSREEAVALTLQWFATATTLRSTISHNRSTSRPPASTWQ